MNVYSFQCVHKHLLTIMHGHESLHCHSPSSSLPMHTDRVIGEAGRGTFGTVLDVYDTKRKRRAALKVSARRKWICGGGVESVNELKMHRYIDR